MEKDEKELLKEISFFVLDNKTTSINVIARHFDLGFNRVNKILNEMEELGIISALDSKKGRKILVNKKGLDNILNNNLK